jgi:hypothetical protein
MTRFPPRVRPETIEKLIPHHPMLSRRGAGYERTLTGEGSRRGGGDEAEGKRLGVRGREEDRSKMRQTPRGKAIGKGGGFEAVNVNDDEVGHWGGAGGTKKRMFSL